MFSQASVWTESTSPSLEIHDLLQKCKSAARTAKAQRRCKLLSSSELRDSIPPRPVSDSLVQLYLETLEPIHRILHIPTFKKEYSQFWENGDTSNNTFFFKLILVLAIGTCFYELDSYHRDLRAQARQWIFATQAWLSGPFEKSRLNLSGLQINCLLFLAREIVSIEGDLVSISGGSLLRMALQLGLHRDPSQLPKISPLQAEIRRRLWETVVEMTVQSSLESGLPPLLSFNDFDTEAPSNVDDADFDESTKIQPASKPLEICTDTSLQLILQKTLQTRLEIVEITNSCRSQPSYDQIINLSSELLDACQSSNNLMQQYSSQETVSAFQPSSFHRNYLNYVLRRALIAIHWPFAAKSQEQPRFYYSRKICLDSALEFASYRESDSFSRLMVLGGGPFRGILVHSGSIITLELLIQLDEDGKSLTSMRKNPIWEPLRTAAGQMLLLAQDRVAGGENNVKGHMFLSMALGQIDARESSAPVESGIYEAAKHSGQVCLDLIKSRTPVKPAPDSTEVPSLQSAHAQQVTLPAANGSEAQLDVTPPFDVSAFEDDLLDFDVPASWLFNGWDEQ